MKNIRDMFFIRYKQHNKNIWVTKKLDNYLIDLSNLKTSSDLQDEYGIIKKLKNGSLQTPLNQLELIVLVAKISNTKKILEIGTFKGFSALYLSKNLGKNVSITTCEIDEDNIADAKKLWAKHNVKNIKIIRGNAEKELRNISEKFDLIYIDADKKQYPKYYELAKKLCSKNGLILMDNMLWASLVSSKKTGYSHARILSDLNQKIYKSENDVSMIPAWDGLVIIKNNSK